MLARRPIAVHMDIESGMTTSSLTVPPSRMPLDLPTLQRDVHTFLAPITPYRQPSIGGEKLSGTEGRKSRSDNPGEDCRLAGPSGRIVRALSSRANTCGTQLFARVSELHVLLNAGSKQNRATQEICHQLTGKLQDFHASILEVDDNLTATDDGDMDASLRMECRDWLKAAQAFVLQLQRQMDNLLPSDLPADTRPDFLQHAADSLASAVEQMNAAGWQDPNAKPVTRRARVVSASSQMPYNAYWARKVAL